MYMILNWVETPFFVLVNGEAEKYTTSKKKMIYPEGFAIGNDTLYVSIFFIRNICFIILIQNIVYVYKTYIIRFLLATFLISYSKTYLYILSSFNYFL